MSDINLSIGIKLRQIRTKRNLSLSELEKMTGVSKSMLGQIERNESNPTVNTMWKIAKGLDVSFSYFIEEDREKVTVISRDNTRPLLEGDGKYRVYPLFTFDQEKKFELYNIEVEPQYGYKSEAHSRGVEEYIVVSRGVLEMIINDNIYMIKEGDAIFFAADRVHTYRNSTDFLVKAHVLVNYPLIGY
ncbi:DNA-binding protein [Orenia metallireducens]|uniref:DNA-binding protein n=1 Tax=Orenia metallireducens TaxID=1413210 RepID=A0A1C0A8F4_9FIRM|nr:XRE family transcriptional regulator [Orenia metallireducens]OCL26525.1 DNA-binding protein [Orenia metallireducens]